MEKDSAFSYPKPQLLLTKPKLNVPLQDKKLPETDKTIPIENPPDTIKLTEESAVFGIALSKFRYLSYNGKVFKV